MPQQTITIGRGSDNSVVLLESNVSTHHARLIVDGNQMFLEDLGSTNGTSVGRVENKISRAAVNPNDAVFFGSSQFNVSELIALASQATKSQATQAAAQAKAARTASNIPAATWVGVAAAGILFLFVTWAAMKDGDEARESDNATSAEQIAATSRETMSPERNALQRDPSPAKAMSDQAVAAVSTAEQPVVDPEEPSQKERLKRSLFLIVCSDAGRSTPFQVGTGFAIDKEHIVTSAAVIKAMQGLQKNGFPEIFLYSPAANAEVGIDSMAIHPQFEESNQVAQQAQREHDAIFDELESTPPKPEAFEAVKEQLIAKRMKALEAMDRQTDHDVAVIKADQPLKYWLITAGEDSRLRPNLKLELASYPVDVQDQYFDPSVPMEPISIPVRVGALLKTSGNLPTRMVVKGAEQQDEYAYLGSPVLNRSGQVVGIYSRPTPPDNEETPPVNSTFDVVYVHKLDDCIAAMN